MVRRVRSLTRKCQNHSPTAIIHQKRQPSTCSIAPAPSRRKSRLDPRSKSALAASRSPSISWKRTSKWSGRNASFRPMSNRAGTELRRSASSTRTTGRRSTCGASAASCPNSSTSYSQLRIKRRSAPASKSVFCSRVTHAILCRRTMTEMSRSPRMTRCSLSYATSVLSTTSTKLSFRMRPPKLTSADSMRRILKIRNRLIFVPDLLT